MEEILHQLIGSLSMFYPIMFKALYIQTVVVWGFLNHQQYYGPSKNRRLPFLALNTPHGACKFQACANISYANFPLDTHVWHLEWDWNGLCRAVKLHADGCQDSMMEIDAVVSKEKVEIWFWGKLRFDKCRVWFWVHDHTTKNHVCLISSKRSHVNAMRLSPSMWLWRSRWARFDWRKNAKTGLQGTNKAWSVGWSLVIFTDRTR